MNLPGIAALAMILLGTYVGLHVLTIVLWLAR